MILLLEEVLLSCQEPYFSDQTDLKALVWTDRSYATLSIHMALYNMYDMFSRLHVASPSYTS